MRRLLFLFMLAGLCLSSLTGVAVPVRVSGERVNLRSAPSLQSEVVAQVAKGDILESKVGLGGEWVEVDPPARVDLWVYKELIRDGVVAVSAVRIRAGEGINYKAVGRLEKGAKVDVRGSSGDWLRIAPPPGCSLWISSDYVESAPQAAVPRPAPAQAAVPVAVAPVKPIWPSPPKGKAPIEPATPIAATDGGYKPPGPAGKSALNPSALWRKYVAPSDAPPAHDKAQQVVQEASEVGTVSGRPLVRGKRQGDEVDHEGRLSRALLVWRRPSPYTLVKRDEQGRYYTACFLLGNETRLSAAVGHEVRVDGRQYWVQGVRDPVVVIDRIVSVD